MPAKPQLSDRQQKALESSLKRVPFLTSEGYRLEADLQRPLIYRVIKPAPELDKQTGVWIEHHDIDLAAGTCSCTLFRFCKGCCHYVWALDNIRLALNLVTPLFVDSGLVVSPQVAHLAPKPAPQAAALSCPHCNHGSTVEADDPGQRVCLKCLRFFDEIHAPEFGGMKPILRSTPLAQSAPQPKARPKPIKFKVASEDAHELREQAPEPRPSRAVPYCHQHGMMVPALRQSTSQNGHLCLTCHDWQPLGAYGARKRPNDNYLLADGQLLELGRSDDLTADDLPSLDDMTGEL